MTIRITKWNGLCLTAEKKHRWCLKIWWLGKWWGRCGFYHADVSYYHHGWTRTRRMWLGPIMVEAEKSLTWGEKNFCENADVEATGLRKSQPIENDAH